MLLQAALPPATPSFSRALACDEVPRAENARICGPSKRTTRTSLFRDVWEALAFSSLKAGSLALGRTSPWGEHRERNLVGHGAISRVKVEARYKQQQQAGTGVDGACEVGANDLRRLTATG